MKTFTYDFDDVLHTIFHFWENSNTIVEEELSRFRKGRNFDLARTCSYVEDMAKYESMLAVYGTSVEKIREELRG